jgi:hypothetical protein
MVCQEFPFAVPELIVLDFGYSLCEHESAALLRVLVEIFLLVREIAEAVPAHIAVEVALLVLVVNLAHHHSGSRIAKPLWILLSVDPIDILKHIHESHLVLVVEVLGTSCGDFRDERASCHQLIDVVLVLEGFRYWGGEQHLFVWV